MTFVHFWLFGYINPSAQAQIRACYNIFRCLYISCATELKGNKITFTRIKITIRSGNGTHNTPLKALYFVASLKAELLAFVDQKPTQVTNGAF